MEKRWGERLAIDLAVRVISHTFSVREGRLTDLSVSGAHLAVDMDVRVMARIEIVLSHQTRHDNVSLQAFVTRKNRDDFGIEWCEFAPPVVRELLHSAVRHPYAPPRRPSAPPMLWPRSSGSLLKHS